MQHQHEGHHPWARIARFLPTTVRERVFWPAYWDLLSDRLRSATPEAQHDWRFAARVIGISFDSVRVSLISSFGTLSRRMRRVIVVLALATLTLLVLVLLSEHYRDGTGGYGLGEQSVQDR